MLLDKSKLFSIGDVAGLFNLSTGTLRHYETLGLITPEYTDPDTGYRYYSVRQFEPLNTSARSAIFSKTATLTSLSRSFSGKRKRSWKSSASLPLSSAR